MTCVTEGEDSTCPFAYTEHSEQAQNYGCLPTRHDIVTMRVKYQKTWACHKYPEKPCLGAIQHLAENNLPIKVVDKELLTEQSQWELYTE